MTRAPIEHLREHGPSTAGELPYSPTYQSRALGAESFRPDPQLRQSDGDRPMHLSCVYYLRDEHDPVAVIRKWIRANPKLVELAPPRTINRAVMDHDKGWSDDAKDAMRDELGESAVESLGQDRAQNTTSYGRSPKYDLSDVDPDEI